MLVFSFALSTLPPARFPDLIQISLLYRSPAFNDFPLPNFTFEVLLSFGFVYGSMLRTSPWSLDAICNTVTRFYLLTFYL